MKESDMITQDPARVLSSLARIDYLDRFGVDTDAAGDATPERWARAMFGDVPSAGAVLVWRGFLGLRLHREASPDTVAGWRIGDRGDDWIRLETNSWFLSANLVVLTSPAQVSLVTCLSYDRFPAGVWWPPLSAVHRRLVPGVLSSAVAEITSGR
jgi:hypothetical protein